MKIFGRTTGVQAEKFKDGPVKNVQLNVGIDKVVENRDKLEVNFTYGVFYQEGIGQIIVKGFLIVEADEITVREAIDLWNKEEKMHEHFAQNVLRTIGQKSTVDAVIASKMVDLPPPIIMPELAIGAEEPPAEEGSKEEKKVH